MSNTDPIPHFLKQVLDQKDIDTLLTNKSNYGPTTNSIKTFTNSLLEYVINTPTPKRYTILEFYIVLKMRHANFLSKQQKTIIDNYGRAFLYLKTGNSDGYHTVLMDKVVKDNMSDAIKNPYKEPLPTLATDNPTVDLISVKQNKTSITLEDILLKRLQLYRSATGRGIDFSLNDEDVRILLERKTCYYTGARFKDNTDYHRTVDRIDNKLGYVKGNVVACTLGANRLKNIILEDTRDNKFVLTITQLKKMVSKL